MKFTIIGIIWLLGSTLAIFSDDNCWTAGLAIKRNIHFQSRQNENDINNNILVRRGNGSKQSGSGSEKRHSGSRSSASRERPSAQQASANPASGSSGRQGPQHVSDRTRDTPGNRDVSRPSSAGNQLVPNTDNRPSTSGSRNAAGSSGLRRSAIPKQISAEDLKKLQDSFSTRPAMAKKASAEERDLPAFDVQPNKKITPDDRSSPSKAPTAGGRRYPVQGGSPPARESSSSSGLEDAHNVIPKGLVSRRIKRLEKVRKSKTDPFKKSTKLSSTHLPGLTLHSSPAKLMIPGDTTMTGASPPTYGQQMLAASAPNQALAPFPPFLQSASNLARGHSSGSPAANVRAASGVNQEAPSGRADARKAETSAPGPSRPNYSFARSPSPEPRQRSLSPLPITGQNDASMSPPPRDPSEASALRRYPSAESTPSPRTRQMAEVTSQAPPPITEKNQTPPSRPLQSSSGTSEPSRAPPRTSHADRPPPHSQSRPRQSRPSSSGRSSQQPQQEQSNLQSAPTPDSSAVAPPQPQDTRSRESSKSRTRSSRQPRQRQDTSGLVRQGPASDIFVADRRWQIDPVHAAPPGTVNTMPVSLGPAPAPGSAPASGSGSGASMSSGGDSAEGLPPRRTRSTSRPIRSYMGGGARTSGDTDRSA